MKTKNLTYSEYHLVFVGMGAANCLLLLKFSRMGILQNKKIAIIEPESKTNNDRTFCFWATESEIDNYCLEVLISKSWNLCTAGPRQSESISPFKYYHVRGIDLYQFTRETISNYDVNFISQFASDELLSEFYCAKIFDSRTPVFEEPKWNETHLIQSFLGWNIETESNVFDTETFVMMDFSIPQHNSTLFLYVLPFNQRNALVEITSFHSAPIDINLANEILNQEIISRFGKYNILGKEVGEIPMSSAKIKTSQLTNDSYFHTGARAGNIKPSTGYSFLNSCQHADKIADFILTESIHPNSKKKNRFTFYDRLLLKILKNQPHLGKPIFEKLFKENKLSKVITFLREESHGLSEIEILKSLPILPFFKVALLDILSQMTVIKTLPVVMGILFHFLNHNHWEFLSYSFLILGLILIGIPHGAIDHLLESKTIDVSVKPNFIIKYISIMLLMGLIWFINPYLGLIIFLLYSSWHFGETEFGKLKLSSFIWGLSLLGCILCSHPFELNQILNEMSINFDFLNFKWIFMISGTFFFFTQLSRGLTKIWEITWLIIGLNLPLLQLFGLFFIFNHSVKSSNDILENFNQSIGKMYKKSLPFTLGALCLCGGFYYFDIWKTDGMTGLFFIFLSCISFPHVFSMHRFYYNFKGTSINKISA